MLPQQQQQPKPEPLRPAAIIQPSSPRYPLSSTNTPTAGAHRKIAIAVDLSDESAFAVKWAVQNYLRPGDAVILLHVRPTSVLYGADWGSIDLSVETDEESQQKLEDDFDAFTTTKATDLAQPLVEAQIPFKLHIVKDHDMKERLCLEVERLGLSAVIMGSRGFGASKRNNKGRLGSVSDYCVHHCVCPVVVVRFPDDKDGGEAPKGDKGQKGSPAAASAELLPVPEEEVEYHDASDGNKDEPIVFMKGKLTREQEANLQEFFSLHPSVYDLLLPDSMVEWMAARNMRRSPPRPLRSVEREKVNQAAKRQKVREHVEPYVPHHVPAAKPKAKNPRMQHPEAIHVDEDDHFSEEQVDCEASQDEAVAEEKAGPGSASNDGDRGASQRKPRQPDQNTVKPGAAIPGAAKKTGGKDPKTGPRTYREATDGEAEGRRPL